jgi:hypothetical protein
MSVKKSRRLNSHCCPAAKLPSHQGVEGAKCPICLVLVTYLFLRLSLRQQLRSFWGDHLLWFECEVGVATGCREWKEALVEYLAIFFHLYNPYALNIQIRTPIQVLCTGSSHDQFPLKVT